MESQASNWFLPTGCTRGSLDSCAWLSLKDVEQNCQHIPLKRRVWCVIPLSPTPVYDIRNQKSQHDRPCKELPNKTWGAWLGELPVRLHLELRCRTKHQSAPPAQSWDTSLPNLLFWASTGSPDPSADVPSKIQNQGFWVTQTCPAIRCFSRDNADLLSPAWTARPGYITSFCTMAAVTWPWPKVCLGRTFSIAKNDHKWHLEELLCTHVEKINRNIHFQTKSTPAILNLLL